MDIGDSSPILTSAPITAMSRSSGTSKGQTQFLPSLDSMVPVCAYARKLSNAYRNRLYPLTPASRRLDFVTARKLGMSKGGLKVGPIAAYTNVIFKEMYRSDIGKLDVEKICGSLSDIAESADFRQTIYFQLLCGLIYQEEVEYITANFAYILAEAFRMLQMEWEQLCEDLRVGELSKESPTPTSEIAC
ncbi:hypothetical protein L7F22_000997 [Adiantum nelumboides]|nr:hypothetical protein [Adiantum nelumboides]